MTLYRVTFVVDQETLDFLLTAHGLTESNEVWVWESTEEVETVA